MRMPMQHIHPSHKPIHSNAHPHTHPQSHPHPRALILALTQPMRTGLTLTLILRTRIYPVRAYPRGSTDADTDTDIV